MGDGKNSPANHDIETRLIIPSDYLISMLSKQQMKYVVLVVCKTANAAREMENLALNSHLAES